jgi:hypothetical protein
MIMMNMNYKPSPGTPGDSMIFGLNRKGYREIVGTLWLRIGPYSVLSSD